MHTANIPAGENGKKPYLDEGDTIYYDTGEHNGKPTAINVSFPIGQAEKKPPRKPRGRNAKKDLDEEAEGDAEASQEEANEKERSANAPGGGGKGGGGKGGGGGGGKGGGRDGATRRRPNSGNRAKRNDRGVAGEGPKPGSGAQPREEATKEAKQEAKQAARESATEA